MSQAPTRKIDYLSAPAQVSMTDGYFEFASLDHFWVVRRFEVFQELAGDLMENAGEMAEVGCGQGLLQRQIEDAYGREVTGFDLNENGLTHNLSKLSRVCCYDIYQCDPMFEKKFELIFLWDVIEHIQNEDEFIQAVLFHLAPSGRLIVNVPAGEWAFSGYDRAAGHARRYSRHSLKEVARRNQLELKEWTYWGLPLMPVLLVRKLRRLRKNDLSKAYSAGFDPGSTAINRVLRTLSRCEWLPQRLLGTSLMAILQAVSGTRTTSSLKPIEWSSNGNSNPT